MQHIVDRLLMVFLKITVVWLSPFQELLQLLLCLLRVVISRRIEYYDQKSLIIGAAFVDVIMDVAQMPTSGSDVTAKLKSYNVGGCAFNVYGAIKHYLGANSADLLCLWERTI